MNDTQVLIVGAGPVGLTMAAFLTHYGIRCQIIDEDAHHTLSSNAVCVHARSLELFEELDLTNTFLNQGVQVKAMNAFIDKIKVADISMSHITSRYPFVCDIPQSETETILLNYLQAQQISVTRNTQLNTIESAASGVTAHVVTEGVGKTISADWLIGCDGYKSTVRNLAQIAYEGSEFEYKFLMIDTPIEGLPSSDTGYFASVGPLSLFIFPMQHSARCIVEVSRSPEFINALPTQEVFSTIVQRCFPFTLKINPPLWSSHFFIHERLAAVYRKDRIFLAGDAAHVHSPAAGQGMNTGMQDVINLSWKLAWVIKNRVNASILDTYQQERRPIAEQVLAMTTGMSRAMLARNSLVNFIRKLFMKYAAKLSFVQKFMVNTIAEIKINYPKSALNRGGNFHHLRPGMRAPLVPLEQLNDKYLILDFSNSPEIVKISTTYSDLIIQYIVSPNDQTIKAAYAGMTAGFCLIRPDRYISYIGVDEQILAEYFSALKQ